MGNVIDEECSVRCLDEYPAWWIPLFIRGSIGRYRRFEWCSFEFPVAGSSYPNFRRIGHDCICGFISCLKIEFSPIWRVRLTSNFLRHTFMCNSYDALSYVLLLHDTRQPSLFRYDMSLYEATIWVYMKLRYDTLRYEIIRYATIRNYTIRYDTKWSYMIRYEGEIRYYEMTRG